MLILMITVISVLIGYLFATRISKFNAFDEAIIPGTVLREVTKDPFKLTEIVVIDRKGDYVQYTYKKIDGRNQQGVVKFSHSVGHLYDLYEVVDGNEK